MPIRTNLTSDARTMARGASVTFVGLVVASVLTFVFTLMGTHALHVSQFGLFALASTVITLATVPALLGLDTAVTRFVALAVAQPDPGRARKNFQTAMLVSLLLSIVIGAGLFAIAPWLCNGPLNHRGAAPLVRISAISLPALVLTQVIISGLQGLGLMRTTAWITPARGVASVLAAAVFLGAGTGVRGFTWAATIAAWVACTLALVTLIRVDRPTVERTYRRSKLRPLLVFSVPQTFTALLFTTVLWTDTLLLAHFSSAANVGIYVSAGRLIVPANLVSTAVSMMFAPRIAYSSAGGDVRVLQSMLHRVTRWNTLVSLPMFVALIVAAKPILHVFGPRYVAGAAALAILSAGQLVNTATGPLGQVINMTGRPYLTMANNFAIAVVNGIFCFILIPRYGLVGAAASTSVSLVLVNFLKVIQVQVLYRMTPFGLDTVRLMAAGLVCTAAGAAAAVGLHDLGWVAQAILIPSVVVASYLIALKIFALSSEDRELISAATGKASRRPASEINA